MASLGFPASSSWAAKGFGFIGLVGEFIGLIEFVGLRGSIGFRVEGRSEVCFWGFKALRPFTLNPRPRPLGFLGVSGCPALAQALMTWL